MPACAHVVQSVCSQVQCGVHTNTATLMLGLAQPSEWDDRNQVRNEGDTDSASLEQRAMYEHVARERDCGWEPTAQQAHSIPFCQHCCQHAATAWPCPPCRTSPCCSLLRRGRAPLLHYIQDAAKSQGSPGPPGRSRLHCVCVCVGCVMLLCRSMRLLLSGWMSLAMRLLRRCFGRCFAYVLGFGFGCSCGLLLAQPPSYARCCVRSSRAGLGVVSDAIGSGVGCQSVVCFRLRFRSFLHSTPHPFITHHTTQYPHTSYTTHHAYHNNTSHHPSLTLAQTQV